VWLCTHGFTKADLLAFSVLERLIEDLDEEYSNPEGNGTVYTDKMKVAAKEFVDVILDEYTSWACELVKRETIDVQEWIKRRDCFTIDVW